MAEKVKKNSRVDNILMILFMVIVIVVVLINYYGTSYINSFIGSLQENIERRLISDCRVLESFTSVEELNTFLYPEDMESEEYQALLKKLKIYAEEQELEFAYFMRLLPDGRVQYIMDSDPNPEQQLGLDFYEEPYWLVTDAYEKKETVVNFIGEYEDGWEGLISAYRPIMDDNGNVVALVGVDISDEEIVTRRNETTAFTYVSVGASTVFGLISFIFIIRYRKKAKDADAASVAKSEFLSKMSHEIRTPMNAIIGFSRMAKKADDPIKVNGYIDNISSSSDYLLELINGILDISKIEANKMTMDIQKMSLKKMISEIEIMLVSQMVKKKQKFYINIPENIPDWIYCDETKLKQILVNLTANAIKFTPEDGEIFINASLIKKTENACNIEFIVRDSGIGIDDYGIKKLFEPFEQADGTITRKYGGTGLGLAISKKFVEMMNGTINATSVVNEGSSFIFDIWVDIVGDSDIPTEIKSTKKSTGSTTVDCTGKTFLVAEDSAVNQVIVKDLLEGFGATIEFANDGQECVDMYSKNPELYDIIFMDIQMPVMDGFEATKNIRNSEIENAKTIPIIAMTAEVFQEDINNSLNAGMNAHLGKPLDVGQVAEAINETLNKTEEE